VSAYAQTPDARIFHSYRYGTGNHLISNVYTQKYHDIRTREILAFLKESVEKYPEALKPLEPALADGGGLVRVKPVRQWAGVLKDESLRGVLRGIQVWLASPCVLAQQSQLDQLWAKWRRGEKAPQVDFSQNLVVVVTSEGGYRVAAVPQLDAKGDLKVYPWAEVARGSGFGYQIAVIPRKGIKTIAGRRVDCGRASCECHIQLDAGYTETAALNRKLYGVCWGDLAQCECLRDDKALHKQVLDAAYAEAARSKKLLLYEADSGWGGTRRYLKACLAEPAVLPVLRKQFVVVCVPVPKLNDCSRGMNLCAYTPDRRPVHTFDWGGGTRFRGQYLEAQHEANTRAVRAFLEECPPKAAAKADAR
jgi:hypothetical protein